MVVALSYIFAVIITLALAVILYPIAGLFWFLGLFGKMADWMFRFTKRAISSLWKDIRNIHNPMNNENNNVIVDDTWTCSCGHTNTGKFCTWCGESKSEPVIAQETSESKQTEQK